MVLEEAVHGENPQGPLDQPHPHNRDRKVPSGAARGEGPQELYHQPHPDDQDEVPGGTAHVGNAKVPGDTARGEKLQEVHDQPRADDQDEVPDDTASREDAQELRDRSRPGARDEKVLDETISEGVQETLDQPHPVLQDGEGPDNAARRENVQKPQDPPPAGFQKLPRLRRVEGAQVQPPPDVQDATHWENTQGPHTRSSDVREEKVPDVTPYAGSAQESRDQPRPNIQDEKVPDDAACPSGKNAQELQHQLPPASTRLPRVKRVWKQAPVQPSPDVQEDFARGEDPKKSQDRLLLRKSEEAIHFPDTSQLLKAKERRPQLEEHKSPRKGQ